MIMKMIALLMLFAVGLMVGPAINALTISSPRHHDVQANLDRMFEMAKDFALHKKNFSAVLQEAFVEDVSNLTHGQNRCQDMFFCKVYSILHKLLQHFGETNDERELVENLKMYNVGRHVKCSEVLKEAPHVGIQIKLHKLMVHLVHCIQQKNLHRTTTSSSLVSPVK